ncbi:hypothetical protein PSTG_12176 [Puccinia striiformis f. sp. tritici PST-78]|uniref:Uncharacterized protein n=1 Tax=Puccinia striiformis f. sp. tritici PST-78 TaxID=1165861 RepID=A0A0L0V5A5_9BASI|nr:hypothetical protein PSTG_12176 [Puccinia striiformis f. sp. tritici PST-78]
MASACARNHPVNVTGLFKTLDESVADSTRANQYGNVTTPSCVSCAGLSGTSPKDFELNLTTNTALNNVLQPASTYFLAGRLISPNDGSTPTLTYQQTSVVRNGNAGPTAPDFTNKVNVIGLGLVVSRQEVVSTGDNSSSYLEVIVQHSDWDSIARLHRSFTVCYIVPGSKIFIKTHGLYVVGRELEITGHLIDFDMDQFTAVVAVNSVSVTTGHQVGRGNSHSNAHAPSGSKLGKKFNKFSPSNSSPSKPPILDPSKSRFTSPPANLSSGCASPSSSHKGKGKASDPADNDGELDDYDSDSPIVSASTPTSSKIRPRPNVLSDAAKRLKQ